MKTNDQLLRITDTNSGLEFAGSVFGIALPLFQWVLAALASGFLVFLVLQGQAEVSTPKALLIAFTPSVLCAVFLLFFFQGKPPSYASDLFESLLTRGHASPLSFRK